MRRSATTPTHPYTTIQELLNAVFSMQSMSYQILNVLAYMLKARTVEPEKQPLLVNGSETTFVSRQWQQKQWNDIRC
jgi:hypothetical protein